MSERLDKKMSWQEWSLKIAVVVTLIFAFIWASVIIAAYTGLLLIGCSDINWVSFPEWVSSRKWDEFGSAMSGPALLIAAVAVYFQFKELRNMRDDLEISRNLHAKAGTHTEMLAAAASAQAEADSRALNFQEVQAQRDLRAERERVFDDILVRFREEAKNEADRYWQHWLAIDEVLVRWKTSIKEPKIRLQGDLDRALGSFRNDLRTKLPFVSLMADDGLMFSQDLSDFDRANAKQAFGLIADHYLSVILQKYNNQLKRLRDRDKPNVSAEWNQLAERTSRNMHEAYNEERRRFMG